MCLTLTQNSWLVYTRVVSLQYTPRPFCVGARPSDGHPESARAGASCRGSFVVFCILVFSQYQVVAYKQGYKIYNNSLEYERKSLQERQTKMLRRSDKSTLRSMAPTKVYRHATVSNLERLDNAVPLRLGKECPVSTCAFNPSN